MGGVAPPGGYWLCRGFQNCASRVSGVRGKGHGGLGGWESQVMGFWDMMEKATEIQRIRGQGTGA